MRDDAHFGEKLVEVSAPGKGVALDNERVWSERLQVALDDARYGRGFDDGKLIFSSPFSRLGAAKADDDVAFVICVELRACQGQQFPGSKIRRETDEERGTERHVAPEDCLHGHSQEARHRQWRGT